MQVSLYLLSAYEEYDSEHMHMCRGHWNYQWGGRRGRPSPPPEFPSLKMRKERFGGLIQNVDGKLYKIDKQAFEVIRRLKDKQPLGKISNEMNIGKDRLLSFVGDLRSLGISPSE